MTQTVGHGIAQVAKRQICPLKVLILMYLILPGLVPLFIYLFLKRVRSRKQSPKHKCCLLKDEGFNFRIFCEHVICFKE